MSFLGKRAVKMSSLFQVTIDTQYSNDRVGIGFKLCNVNHKIKFKSSISDRKCHPSSNQAVWSIATLGHINSFA